MREKFWILFMDLKFKECYVEAYRSRINRINNCITGFCLIFSAGSILAWPIWQQIALVWNILLGAVQVLQVIKPLFPYSVRLSATKYAGPELNKLLIDLEHEWNDCGEIRDCSESEYNDCILKYQQLYNQVVCRYLGDLVLPRCKRPNKKASAACKNYFARYYQVTEWRDISA